MPWEARKAAGEAWEGAPPILASRLTSVCSWLGPGFGVTSEKGALALAPRIFYGVSFHHTPGGAAQGMPLRSSDGYLRKQSGTQWHLQPPPTPAGIWPALALPAMVGWQRARRNAASCCRPWRTKDGLVVLARRCPGQCGLALPVRWRA